MVHGFKVLLLLAMSGTALASPAALQVDSGASNVTVTLCLTACGTQCDSDMSPISGSIVAGLDCLTQPGNLVLHDFHFALNNVVVLNLNFEPFAGDSTPPGPASP